MNAVSRIDFISQRLDDYPRMRAIYLQETEEWWNWWLTEDYQKRAQQAALIFTHDEKHYGEEEKLSSIARTLGAEKAQIVSAKEYETLSEQVSIGETAVCSAELEDGRLLALTFLTSAKSDRLTFLEDESYFLSQLQAGLPGYICILHEGSLSFYPKDENEEALRNMISRMLESGKLNPAALMKKAKNDGQRTALKITWNSGANGIPTGKYLLYTAAYTDNEDFVIDVTESATLFRFGRKRSWILWYLCCSIMILFGQCIWKTRLYRPEVSPGEEYFAAVRRSIPALAMAFLLTLASVIVVQMLSGVNLAQQGATDQTEYLKKVLAKEDERATNITKEFDSMYVSRAQTAASVLSEDPQLIDVDFLHDLDHTLGGSGLKVFNADGTLLASDELLHRAVDESIDVYGFADLQNSSSAEDDGKTPENRYYRAVIVDETKKSSGWVELCVKQSQLDELLRDTRLEEVIGDLHILDTLHAVVVESGADGKIVASTWKSWVGESAAEHGIHTDLLLDDYEGIINFDGNKCYSVVFSFGSYYVIVGSENETALVFIGGVLILTLLLVFVLFFAVCRPLIKETLAAQKRDFSGDPVPDSIAHKEEYPSIREYVSNFMLLVFLLTSILYFTTKGNPAGLTYNIVRGTWIRGVNAATVTTSIMLFSVVFAVQRLIDVILLLIGKYLSPKGMTICRLLDSGLTYIGTIVMIIYALSMFGVNTATLVGGVGATALIFTLGANSLIADVLAGMFIIFEGDFTVGDVVVINGFRGIVTDITMRTTKLMDDNTRDIKIINNSAISELTNQSRENSAVIVDIPISRSIGLEKGEEILKEAIEKLPDMFPKIIGEAEYWGVSSLPSKNPYTGKLGGIKARIAFSCRESDKEMLTYQVYRSLVSLVNNLNTTPAPQDPIAPQNPTSS
ncbi:MAG: mechanosensitive ion channel [Stomatobaculum sp.]|nr:mechanosensitive ion channel [Stomatobaculum sp.]